MGMVLVQLTWLEAWNYQRLLESLVPSDLLLSDVATPEDRRVSRHLEQAAAKCQAAQLLVRLRMVRENLDSLLPSSTVLPSQAVVPAPESRGEACTEHSPPDWEQEPRCSIGEIGIC